MKTAQNRPSVLAITLRSAVKNLRWAAKWGTDSPTWAALGDASLESIDAVALELEELASRPEGDAS